MKSLARIYSLWLVGLQAAFASVTIKDPSDVIDPADWAADNAIVPDYNVPFPASQPSDSKWHVANLNSVLRQRLLIGIRKNHKRLTHNLSSC